MNNRIKRLFTNCPSVIEALIVKNASAPYIDDNFFYLSALQHGLFEGSIAIAKPDGHLDLIVPPLEAQTAQKASATVHVYKSKAEKYSVLEQLLSSQTTIGINSNALTTFDFQQLTKNLSKKTFEDVSETFQKTRLIKEKEEIKKIQKACEISDIVMEQIPHILKENMTENQLAAEINYHLQKNGAEKPAFDTMASFDIHTAEPHYGHGNTRLKRNSYVLCDFGACYQKYNADTTRTFIYGKASKKHKEMYNLVLDAQQVGIDSIEPGKQAKTIHSLVSQVIDDTKYKGRFIHSTGHSLGLAVHDNKQGLGPQSTIELQENMVFTVEPGIYVPDFGGVRIEDTIRVTSTGAQRLTKSKKSLIEVQ